MGNTENKASPGDQGKLGLTEHEEMRLDFLNNWEKYISGPILAENKGITGLTLTGGPTMLRSTPRNPDDAPDIFIEFDQNEMHDIKENCRSVKRTAAIVIRPHITNYGRTLRQIRRHQRTLHPDYTIIFTKEHSLDPEFKKDKILPVHPAVRFCSDRSDQ
jgi:hypothetical protein